MAKEDTSVNPRSDVQELAQSFVSAVTAIVPTPKVKFGQHSVKSWLNPTGNRNRKLKRAMFQNGNPLNTRFLSDDEIQLLDQIKPGLYVDGLITVIEKNEGLDKVVHIIYKNRTNDQRQDLAAKGCHTFTSMLTRIVKEQGEELAKKSGLVRD